MMAIGSLYMFQLGCVNMYGLAKRQALGSVNFVTALAFHFCLALRAPFTQPGDHRLAEPCIICVTWLHVCITFRVEVLTGLGNRNLISVKMLRLHYSTSDCCVIAYNQSVNKHDIERKIKIGDIKIKSQLIK